MIHVVAAVIFNAARDQVLIARRPEHLHMGGLWEFPGGKVHADEKSVEALARELEEELAITVTQAAHWMDISHSYPDKEVFLEIWQVTDFMGVPRGCEGQSIAWTAIAALEDYPFPAANQPVISRLSFRNK